MKTSIASLLVCSSLLAQNRFTPGARPFITVDAPVIALEHVRIIDGTGAAPMEDRTIVIDHGLRPGEAAGLDPGRGRTALTLINRSSSSESPVIALYSA